MGIASFSNTPPEFDHYTISRVLGEGGMGRVYLANDRRTGLPVAIKVMSGWASDPELQARFLKESRILSALSHRNIVRCYEITESRDGILSIVMGYVDGVDFRAFEGRPFPELDAVAVHGHAVFGAEIGDEASVGPEGDLRVPARNIGGGELDVALRETADHRSARFQEEFPHGLVALEK